MTAAEPRRNANGDSSIRPIRIGTSSSSLPSFEAWTVATGSGRSLVGAQAE